MADEAVLFETRGNIAVISINRPQRRNAIDSRTTHCLRTAINRFETEDALAVGIIRGEGPVFCSGMDLQAFLDGKAEEILFGDGRLGGLVSRARQKPLIAAVHGVAVGGGFELMLACDLVVAAETCRFALPEAKRGLVAGAGGAFRLGERLPPALANEILLTAEPFGAARAYQLGLVNRVVPESGLLESALDLAEMIARNAPLSLRASLALSNAAGEAARERLWRLNDSLLRGLLASADAAEGAAAFTQKRGPDWQGE
ncbi:enoyl-CoA hydratase-related protein [Mesorhizobium sp.]|uniref:enoyl-CoA hydratase-related protein n=1 Tax=Mesorhizobium sp. TaxID=1871066 RepID=UPI000FE46083|nr:enoyl-CoA hydratase-related protein [Mesorhizobium sp.]RWG00843.1 MAG: crotonase [Mesorhizobium sp.]RWG96599.1 MAG: crotonase [Mesorhizobium sp.]TIN48745.1 MAG: crotonase [Mesorhizobium sp.]